MPRALRVAWATLSLVVVESVLIGLAAAAPVMLLQWLGRATAGSVRLGALLLAVGPAFLVFALGLMVLSASAMRALGWRTPPAAALRIADAEWPLLHWARGLASTHVVRLLAGGLLRATPLWSLYLRLNGARVGRRVFVNSLQVMDHNLLELNDGVVIGSAAHLSGHTVEHGIVKTGPVRLERNVTIGVGSVIGIDVAIGADTQVGALSLVPKHARLPPGAVYAGIPVQRIDAHRDRRLAFVN
jgi:acetyltransferase-like isoleucine patch superfamily enzyme